MLLQKAALEDLFHTVESYHKMDLWKVYCSAVDKQDIYFSGAASDELYFNFVFSKTDQVKIRHFKWENITRIKDIPHYKKRSFHYVSCHTYMRES
jgi:hypothetical protein